MVKPCRGKRNVGESVYPLAHRLHRLARKLAQKSPTCCQRIPTYNEPL